ncbi:hypothetical protein D2E80_11935 [Mycobacteroides abscessus]|nr:hypothetical protein D2E80_11935 [Mycobacteroides abscessus]
MDWVNDDEPRPPVEFCPPYSLDFVAHLHGGCYPDAITPGFLAAVRRDAIGRRMLDEIAIAQLELVFAAHSSPRPE